MASRPQKRVSCPDNEDLASFLWARRDEMVQMGTIVENLDLTLYKAYCNICDAKNPIATLKDASQVKGIGKWIITLLQGYFQKDSVSSQSQDCQQEKRKTKETKRYIPHKNSAAYALLITLYRRTTSGVAFMRKQELIDAAEASGLSRVSIGLGKSDGKPGRLGSSGRDWYCGWNCMKTLILRGLIVKSSSPAKYMLTQEGQEAARECLSRSGIADSEVVTGSSDTSNSISMKSTEASDALNILPSTKTLPQPTVVSSILKPCKTKKRHTTCSASSVPSISQETGQLPSKSVVQRNSMVVDGATQSSLSDELTRPFNMRPCTSFKTYDAKDQLCSTQSLAMPPGMPGESFKDVYDVILILDDREQFARSKNGSHSSKVVESLRLQFKLLVEALPPSGISCKEAMSLLGKTSAGTQFVVLTVNARDIRRLPVGDGVWVARHKHDLRDYVLDFIVERKKVDDLRFSIRDNRYKDQKLRLLRCGLQKLIYLVEGDPNYSEAAESIKSACFTTEILEGFDVHRTSGLFDTVKKYGYLTHSITSFYELNFLGASDCRKCLAYDEFVSKCEDLGKMTTCDVFAIQLMQVPLVTEEIALAVVDMYPTLVSLARAYSLLGDDLQAQEKMLCDRSKLVGKGASRNIFKFIWGA